MGTRKALKARPRCSPSKAEVIIDVPHARSYNGGRAGLVDGAAYVDCVVIFGDESPDNSARVLKTQRQKKNYYKP